MTISLLRAGIAKNLSSIVGLREAGTGFVAPTINPPYALIQPSTVDYHKTFHNGMSDYSFVVTVVVGQASERTAQALLDQFCDSSGAKSIRQAIELDRTLDGQAFDCVVTAMRNYGSIVIGENNYLAAEFDVVVKAE